MKSKKLFVLGLVTVFVALLSLTLVSGTWAKYTSTVTGSDSARVAKWAWAYKGANITGDTITFDLFNTVMDSNGTSAETDVKVGEGETIIAPGTSGEFYLQFTNNSEVNAKFSVEFAKSVTDQPIPVEFKINDSEWVSNIADLNITDQAINMGETCSNIKVQWRWEFEAGTDANDTALGTLANTTQQKMTVSATVTFTQVD